MKTTIVLIMLWGITSLFCCDSGYFTVKADAHLIDGSVVKGLFFASGELEDSPFLVKSIIPGRKLKDGDDLLPYYRKIITDTYDKTIMIAQKHVSLYWGFYYISDATREIPVDSVQSIIYQSEKETVFNGQRMFWHSLSASDYALLQGMIYGVYFGEDPMVLYVYINTNEKLTSQELELYGMEYFTGSYSIENPVPTLVSKFSGSHEISHDIVEDFQYKGIQRYFTNMLENQYNCLESYKKPLKDNELYTDSSKVDLLSKIDIAQKDMKLLTSFINKHSGEKDSDLPLEKYPERLRELAKSYNSFELSNSLFLSIFAVVDRPNILGGFEFEWIKDIDEKALYRKLGIVVLETLNPMGGY